MGRWDTHTAPRRRWWRRKVILIPGALLAVTVTVTVAVVVVVITSRRHENQHREPAYGSQITMPFTGLYPNGVAVDAAGSLYVTDYVNNRVLKLAAGSGTPTVLPFTGLRGPSAIAVDTAGNIYVIADGHRAVELAAGSGTPTVAAPHRPHISRRGGGGQRRQCLCH